MTPEEITEILEKSPNRDVYKAILDGLLTPAAGDRIIAKRASMARTAAKKQQPRRIFRSLPDGAQNRAARRKATAINARNAREHKALVALLVRPQDLAQAEREAPVMLDVGNPGVMFKAGWLNGSKARVAQKVAQRRIRVADLLEFKKRDDAEREAALEELAAEAQKHGLGY